MASLTASLGAFATLSVAPAFAMPPTTFNPVVEAQNFSITQQRQTAPYECPAVKLSLPRLRSVTIPAVAGNKRHRVRVYEYKSKGFARRVTRWVYGCAAGKRKPKHAPARHRTGNRKPKDPV